MSLSNGPGVSVAIVTYNNHSLKVKMQEGSNSILFLQHTGRPTKNSNNKIKEKLTLVRDLLAQLKRRLNFFEKIIIYTGDGLGAKIIKLAADRKLPPDKVIFLSSKDNWNKREDEALSSHSFLASQVVIFKENPSDAMYDICQKILTKGELPH